jgi:hypothetical protein
MTPSRTVLNLDAITWLEKFEDAGRGAIITGVPDSDDLKLPVEKWRDWFSYAVLLCLRAAHPDACTIFCLTDRKKDGALISKAHLMVEQAKQAGVRLLWHKIVLRHAVGAVDLYRQGYSHMMAFSRNMSSGSPTPDVLHAGTRIYKNATGVNAAKVAVQFATSKQRHLIIDPFCGHGTVLAVANALGFDALGIDIDEQECKLSAQCIVDVHA